MSSDAYDVLVESEKPSVQLDAQETGLSENATKVSAEVYVLLCQTCSGEAMALVR